jgi:hypothetical protein
MPELEISDSKIVSTLPSPSPSNASRILNATEREAFRWVQNTSLLLVCIYCVSCFELCRS